MKKLLFKWFTSLLLFCSVAFAGEIWLPATIIVTPPGLNVAQHIPLPVTGKPGPAVGDALGGGFFPVVGGNVSAVRRIYAVESLNDRGSQVSGLADVSGEEIFLNPKSPSGYRVLYSNNKALTLAGAATAGPGGFLCLNATLMVGGTLSSSFLYNKYVRTIDEAKKVGSIINPSIPLNADAVNKILGLGDSISYTKSGELFMNASVGAGWIVNAGVGVSAASNWKTTIGRLKSDKVAGNDSNKTIVEVTYKAGKDVRVSAALGNLVSSLSIAKIKEKAKSMKFVFDLSNTKKVPAGAKTIILAKDDKRIKKLLSVPALKNNLKESRSKMLKNPSGSYEIDLQGMTAELAYQLAIKGNVTVAEIISDPKMNYGVRMVSKEETVGSKISKGAGFKIPWLFTANFSKTKGQTFSDLKMLGNDTAVVTYNGLVSRDWSTGSILSNDLSRTKVFSGMVQIVEDLTNPSPNGSQIRYAGNLTYASERNNVDAANVINEVRNIKEIFGLKKIFDPMIAKLKNISQRSNAKVSSFKLKTDLILSDAAIETLVKVANEWDEQLVTEAHLYLDGFADKFKRVDYKTGETFDPTSIRNKMSITSVAKKELCRSTAAKTLDLCISELKRGIKSNIRKALDAAKKINSIILTPEDKDFSRQIANASLPQVRKAFQFSGKENQYAEFANALRDMGDAISYNRFTLKTFLRAIRYVCKPSTYLKLAKSRPDMSQEDLIKVCPERKIINNGKQTKVPYVIKFSLASSELPNIEDIFYGKEFARDLK